MSKDFEYDPETGSFRFDEGGKTPKKKDGGDIGSWIIIAALFAFGLWPIGLIALISKLSDRPKKVSSPRSGMRTSTSPNANVTARSTNKVEKTVVQTAKKMNRAPKTSDKTARTLMIIGGIIALAAGSGLILLAAGGKAEYHSHGQHGGKHLFHILYPPKRLMYSFHFVLDISLTLLYFSMLTRYCKGFSFDSLVFVSSVSILWIFSSFLVSSTQIRRLFSKSAYLYKNRGQRSLFAPGSHRKLQQLLHAVFVGLNHFLDHLAAHRARLPGGQVAIVALLQVDTDLVGGLHLKLIHSLAGAGNNDSVAVLTVRHTLSLLFFLLCLLICLDLDGTSAYSMTHTHQSIQGNPFLLSP